MTENTLIPVGKADVAVLFSEQLDGVLAEIEKQATAHLANVTTSAGRDAIKALAYKVVRSKTFIDDMGKEANSERKKKTDIVNGFRKKARDFLDELREKIRAPLTGWEMEQLVIKADKEAAEKKKAQERVDSLLKVGVTMDFFDCASMTDDAFELTLGSAEREYEDEQERIQIETEKKAEKEATEKLERETEAKRLADVAAEQEKKRLEQEKVQKELEAFQAKLKAAQDKIDADNKAAAEKIEKERKLLERQRRTVRNQALKNADILPEGDEVLWWENIKLKEVNFVSLTDDEFSDLVADLGMRVRDLKEKAAKDAEALKVKLAEEAKTKAEADAKETADRLAQEKVEAETEAERQETLKPDKDKLIALAQFLQEGIKYPELKSKEANIIRAIIAKQIYDLGEELLQDIEGL